MARLEVRSFPQPNDKPPVKHLLIVMETAEESKLVDNALGDQVPLNLYGVVKLSDDVSEHYIRVQSGLGILGRVESLLSASLGHVSHGGPTKRDATELLEAIRKELKP